jgi:hypothetical protein
MQSLAKQLEEERKEKEMLEAKIQSMESKVLQGGVNLLEKVSPCSQLFVILATPFIVFTLAIAFHDVVMPVSVLSTIS